MEVRLAKLEDMFVRMEVLLRGLDDRLRKLETDIAEIKGKVSQLPSSWFMLTALIGSQVTLAAIIFVALKLSVH